MPHRNIAQLVVDNARDYAIITLDLEQLVTSWSSGAEAILGWSAEEAIGRPGAMIFTPEDREDGAPQRECKQARINGHGLDERWHLHKDGRRFWGSGEMLPILDEGALTGYLKILRDRTAERQIKQQLELERNQLQRMFEQAPGFFAMLRGPEHRFEIVNPQYLKMVGHRDVVGKPVRVALPELAGQGFYELLDGVFASGTAFVGTALPIDLQQSPGAPMEHKFLDFVYQPVKDESGAVSGIFVQGTDVTERKHAEELQKTLNAEIGHRMKNQMAMMSSIVRQSLRDGSDVEAGRTAILDRIGVLSRANDLLLTEAGSRARIGAVVEQSVEFAREMGRTRFTFRGPDFYVGPRAALSLAMILHELTTNAVKYGALSVETGHVTIAWDVELAGDHRQFTLNWSEAGGPPASPPARNGFGTRLLKGGISGATSEITTDYNATGLQYSVRASLAGMLEED